MPGFPRSCIKRGIDASDSSWWWTRYDCFQLLLARCNARDRVKSGLWPNDPGTLPSARQVQALMVASMTDALAQIPEYHDVDRAMFEREIVPAGQPAVLRSLLSEWPVVVAAVEGVEALAAYLRERTTEAAGEAWFASPSVGGRFGFNESLDGYNFDRKSATIDQLLDLLLRQRGASDQYGIFAGALPIRRHAPAMLAENVMPLLDADRYMLASLWLGNRTKTAAHWDLPQNLACIVAGTRRFTLFPTEAVAHLYVGPLDFMLAGQPSSLADVEAPDFERFPKLREALAVAQVAELEPGDAIYIPSLWWHAVSGHAEVGAMVNYWWRDGPARMMTPQLSLMHALLTMKELPERERAAWRVMFEHYVFQAGDDPARHLPDQAKGILGEQSPQQIARTKQMLSEALIPPQ